MDTQCQCSWQGTAASSETKALLFLHVRLASGEATSTEEVGEMGNCSERHKSSGDPGTRLQWPYSGAMNTLFPDPLLFMGERLHDPQATPKAVPWMGPHLSMTLVLFGSLLLSPVCVMEPLWSEIQTCLHLPALARIACFPALSVHVPLTKQRFHVDKFVHSWSSAKTT